MTTDGPELQDRERLSPVPALDTPYFCQWESPDLVKGLLAREISAADDPGWRTSGAESLEEYAHWAGHLCGMACLKMVLAARSGRVWPMMALARGATAEGGYVVEGDQVRGLIYAPFVRYLAEAFSITAEVRTGLEAGDLPAILARSDYFLASVHHSIRWPDRVPEVRGGHLVLVTRADAATVTFHNPSGHTPETQANAVLPLEVFARFFAGRGVSILPPAKP